MFRYHVILDEQSEVSFKLECRLSFSSQSQIEMAANLFKQYFQRSGQIIGKTMSDSE